jgi:hypothetical protein
MLGASLSTTVIVKVQVVVLGMSAVSVAVQVTVVTPLEKAVPEAGEQDTVAPGLKDKLRSMPTAAPYIAVPAPNLWLLQRVKSSHNLA